MEMVRRVSFGGVHVNVAAQQQDITPCDYSDDEETTRLLERSSREINSAADQTNALLLAQASFVVGAVIFKACLQQLDESAAAAFHPIKFVLLRCALATPILLSAAKIMTGGWMPQRRHMHLVALLGLFLFLNQGLFIVGLQHAGALLASCIQPAIPTWTHMLAVMCGVEHRTWQGTLGVVVAMLGAACMTLRDLTSTAPGSASSPSSPLSGVAFGIYCLLGNTASMAAYLVVAKQLQPGNAPIVLTAWAYVGSTTFLTAAVALTNPPTTWLDPLPRIMWAPLAFWVLFCSVAAYFAITTATRYLRPSEVAAYQCVQPLFGALLAVIILHEHPTWFDLGALGVIGGMLLVTQHAPGE